MSDHFLPRSGSRQTSKFLVSGEEYLAAHPQFKLVGRADELKNISNILMGQTANNPILTGRRGVGITSLIMGLQTLKDDPATPFDMAGKEYFWLDTDELFSSGDPKQIDQNFRKVIDTMTELSDTVLVIQNVKEFIDAAKTRNCAHFINALMLALDEGKFQAFLECRDNHLSEVKACHPRFEEVFTQVEIGEPDPASLKSIVAEAVKKLEAHTSGIRVSPEAQDAAHKLLGNFPIPQLDMAQPGLTMKLLELSLNNYRLESHAQPVAPGSAEERLRQDIRDLRASRFASEKELVNLRVQLESAQQDQNEKARGENEGKRASAEDKTEQANISSLMAQIEKLSRDIKEKKELYDQKQREANSKLVMPAAYVLAQFSKLSGIPVTSLSQDERERLLHLEESISKRVVGQPDPVRALARAVRRGRLNLKKQKEPIGSFLFLGPSGAGKTELARALAFFLFGGENALQHYDMSGFKGDGAEQKFTDAVVGRMRKRPYCVNLFDEIEKGHHEIPDLFLQMGDGQMTNSLGLTAAFANAVNIVTSNIGQEYFYEKISFEEACKKAEADLRNPEKSIFRNEVLNRFTGIFFFRPLGYEQAEIIARSRFNSLNESLKDKNFSVSISDGDLKLIVRDHYIIRGGARSITKYIDNTVADDAAVIVLQSADEPGVIEVTYNDSDKTAETKLAPRPKMPSP